MGSQNGSQKGPVPEQRTDPKVAVAREPGSVGPEIGSGEGSQKGPKRVPKGTPIGELSGPELGPDLGQLEGRTSAQTLCPARFQRLPANPRAKVIRPTIAQNQPTASESEIRAKPQRAQSRSKPTRRGPKTGPCNIPRACAKGMRRTYLHRYLSIWPNP